MRAPWQYQRHMQECRKIYLRPHTATYFTGPWSAPSINPLSRVPAVPPWRAIWRSLMIKTARGGTKLDPSRKCPKNCAVLVHDLPSYGQSREHVRVISLNFYAVIVRPGYVNGIALFDVECRQHLGTAVTTDELPTLRIFVRNATISSISIGIHAGTLHISTGHP